MLRMAARTKHAAAGAAGDRGACRSAVAAVKVQGDGMECDGGSCTITIKRCKKYACATDEKETGYRRAYKLH